VSRSLHAQRHEEKTVVTRAQPGKITLSLRAKPSLHFILSHYLPPEALDYCVHLIESSGVGFKISRERRTKWGDYRFGKTVHPRITVNANLPKEAFLLTFLHEYAHHMVHVSHGNKALPHGYEWKRAFQEVAKPMLTSPPFSAAILPILQRHMNNPSASATADPALFAYFSGIMHPPGEAIEMLSIGDLFSFRGITYKRGVVVRTRIKALNISNNRWYLFRTGVRVERVIL
jgi:hypothetical protein